MQSIALNNAAPPFLLLCTLNVQQALLLIAMLSLHIPFPRHLFHTGTAMHFTLTPVNHSLCLA